MQLARSDPVSLPPPVPPDLWGDGGNRRETFEQRLEVKPRPTHDDGTQAFGLNFEDRVFGFAHEPPDRVAFPHRHVSIQTMRSLGQLLCLWARGQNAQFFIDLHAVGIEDHATGFPRQTQGKGGFAARGRSRNQDRSHVSHRSP